MSREIEKGFLVTGIKSQCLGCSACVQVCAHKALEMHEDEEGFKYPVLDAGKCITCSLCHKVCPEEIEPAKHEDVQTAFGGYALDERVRCLSTSGGAFSIIVEAWWRDGSVVFGAAADGLKVFHTFIEDLSQLEIFRKSKYSQSEIGDSFSNCRKFLQEGKRVLFSGTPCQIAGLVKFLSISKIDWSNLLTVEVVCEGVPSPLYIRKMDKSIEEHYGSPIQSLDYRYKDGKFENGKPGSPIGRWDFQVMAITSKSSRFKKIDRWFNPFWSIWLQHLMNRPSCYRCPYATRHRVADLTLGDLWGVHLYCPELYGRNGGSSVIVANTVKGKKALKESTPLMYGHSLDVDDVVRYQGPMRKRIPMNPQREEFMTELENPDITFKQLNRKWAKRPTVKLIWQKYVWGNQQKVRWWKFKQKISNKGVSRK